MSESRTAVERYNARARKIFERATVYMRCLGCGHKSALIGSARFTCPVCGGIVST